MQAVAVSAPLWAGASVRAMVDASDETLVAQAKAGDVGAFGELVKRHEGLVFNLALRYMGDPASADDMAQEAFLKAFRLLRGFRGDAAFTTWLYRVTSSVCLTELRRRARRKESPLDEVALRRRPADTVAPEDADLRAAVRRCIGRLPERYATVIGLYYLQQRSYEEISEMLDVPLGTLKTWMHRARHRLRALIEKELDSGG